MKISICAQKHGLMYLRDYTCKHQMLHYTKPIQMLVIIVENKINDKQTTSFEALDARTTEPGLSFGQKTRIKFAFYDLSMYKQCL